jgi:hypothetical protein
MHLPGSRWQEANLVSVVRVLILLAVHPVGSLWKEIKLACAEHVLELFATHLPGSRSEEMTLPTRFMCSHRCIDNIKMNTLAAGKKLILPSQCMYTNGLQYIW